MTISLFFLSLNMPSVDKNAEELEFSYPMEGNVYGLLLKVLWQYYVQEKMYNFHLSTNSSLKYILLKNLKEYSGRHSKEYFLYHCML